jgi:hypothetical protein
MCVFLSFWDGRLRAWGFSLPHEPQKPSFLAWEAVSAQSFVIPFDPYGGEMTHPIDEMRVGG